MGTQHAQLPGDFGRLTTDFCGLNLLRTEEERSQIAIAEGLAGRGAPASVGPRDQPGTTRHGQADLLAQLS